MNPALSRVNQERRAFPSQSVAESSWQKSMWFCLIMINVFTYFIILQAIFFFFQFFILLEDDLAIATHKPESLVLYHLIAYQQEDATSSGMWLILNFHFLVTQLPEYRSHVPWYEDCKAWNCHHWDYFMIDTQDCFCYPYFHWKAS